MHRVGCERLAVQVSCRPAPARSSADKAALRAPMTTLALAVVSGEWETLVVEQAGGAHVGLWLVQVVSCVCAAHFAVST